MENLWKSVCKVQLRYEKGLITEQERNFNMMLYIIADSSCNDQKKDKRTMKLVEQQIVPTRELVLAEAKRLGFLETVEATFKSLNI